MEELQVRLSSFIARLQEQRVHDKERIAEPEEPEWFVPEFEQYRLKWAPTQLPPLDETRPLEDVRQGIYARILSYAKRRGDRYAGEASLIHVPPGVGKTTESVRAAQDYVESTGKRVLYVSSRKNFFSELLDIPGMKPEHWYYWRSLFENDPETGEPMCKYCEEMRTWIDRGYASFDLCEALCRSDGYMGFCPYREQRHKTEPIIFGRHAHLITGMSIKNYRLAICDEMPISAFTTRVRIPVESILIDEATGTIRRLLEIFYTIARSAHSQVAGADLMSMCAPVLDRLYTEVEVLGDVTPLAPAIYSPEQVNGVPFFFLPRLLSLLSPELECYQNGWSRWITRVTVGPLGIVMYYRKHVRKMWRGDRPRKLVVLDATGSPSLYKRILEREVEVYSPQVVRQGHVYQIVARQNGFTQTFVKEDKQAKLKRQGRELLNLVRLIAAQYEGKRVGVVTFKAIKHLFAEIVGEHNVLHFGGLRGSNLLETCDCLIIAGGYTPNTLGLQTLAAQLNPERMMPFSTQNEEGHYLNPWTRQLREYRMKELRGEDAPFYPVGGFWDDEDLDVLLDEYRGNELMQAIHRSRLVSRPSDVWVLTSIPTPEPLDEIYDDLGDLPFIPRREQEGAHGMGTTWQNWVMLKPHLDAWWDEGREVVTVTDMAEVTGVQLQTIISQKWIEGLDAFYRTASDSRPWGMKLHRPQWRARHQRVLVPLEACDG